MTRIVLWIASTVTVLVLLFGYSTSTSGPGLLAEDAVVASTAEAGADAAVVDATVVTGPAVDTRGGPVQVQVTVSGGPDGAGRLRRRDGLHRRPSDTRRHLRDEDVMSS
jgi:hypothetical protein